jgi:hypothetical protein
MDIGSKPTPTGDWLNLGRENSCGIVKSQIVGGEVE